MEVLQAVIEWVVIVSLTVKEYLEYKNSYLTLWIECLTTLSLLVTTLAMVAWGIHCTAKPFASKPKLTPEDAQGD